MSAVGIRHSTQIAPKNAEEMELFVALFSEGEASFLKIRKTAFCTVGRRISYAPL
jgi:hypothetical protein